MTEKGDILVVTYYLPPKNHVASMRIGGLCKFLSELGWNVIVLTANHPEGVEAPYEIVSSDAPQDIMTRVIESYKRNNTTDDPGTTISGKHGSDGKINSIKNVVEQSLRPVVRFVRNELFYYPDDKRLWEDKAVKAGNNLIPKKDVSCMISSSGPFTCHRIASRLSEQHELPWIADYRDCWTQNPYREHTFIRDLIEKRMEKRIIKSADSIVAVSEPIANDLSDLHKKDVRTIVSGYDRSRYPEVDLNNKFTIMYPGQFYRGKRNPEILFSALSYLIDDGKIDYNEMQIQFYGYAQPWVIDLAEEYGVSRFVMSREKVDKSRILKRERESHILLSLHWGNNRSEGVYTGKLFEYLGAGRPIVAITPPDIVQQLLNETGAGASFYSSEGLANYLYEQFKTFQKTGEVKYDTDNIAMEKYSQRRMAEEFEHIILENNYTT